MISGDRYGHEIDDEDDDRVDVPGVVNSCVSAAQVVLSMVV